MASRRLDRPPPVPCRPTRIGACAAVLAGLAGGGLGATAISAREWGGLEAVARMLAVAGTCAFTLAALATAVGLLSGRRVARYVAFFLFLFAVFWALGVLDAATRPECPDCSKVGAGQVVTAALLCATSAVALVAGGPWFAEPRHGEEPHGRTTR